MKLGERIEASGLTDKQLATATGAHPVTAWKWRHGLKRPSRTYLTPLAAALKCSPADLDPQLAQIFAR